MKPERINEVLARWAGSEWAQCRCVSVKRVNPDFYHDLNAVHELEKRLDERQQVFYLQRLSMVRLAQGDGGTIARIIDKTTFATAPQRCEALLRTLNMWEDE